METFNYLMAGFGVALAPENLLFALIGCVLGTLIGVLPGIGPAAGTAILIPVTFQLGPTAAIIMLTAIYYGAQYGGTITSVMLNLPGESSSVATCFDGYAMASRGRAGAALGIAAVGSFVGGTIATLGLVVLALPLANFALKFGPPENFALLVVGLSLVMGLAGKSLVRALMMGILGLIVAHVGLDPSTGVPRFTFGVTRLLDGVSFIPVIMGLFGVGEILYNLEAKSAPVRIQSTRISSFLPEKEERRVVLGAMARGTGLGFFLGLIPGMNTAIASLGAYVAEKKASRHPEKFGEGVIEGVVAPETANNSFANAALIPLFTLGIPGSPTIAIILGAFMMHGLAPGPLLFTQDPDVVWGIIASLYIGNIILLVLNLPLVGWWIKLFKIPYSMMLVITLVLCVIGAYSLANSLFDVGVLIVCGVLGYVFKKLDYPLAPTILTIILGPLLETSFRESIAMSQGSYSIFFTRPISVTFVILAVIILLCSLRSSMASNFREQSKTMEA